MLLHDHNSIGVTSMVISCRFPWVLISDPFLTLADCTDVLAIIFLLLWVTMATIMLNAKESTPSTIGAVVPKLLLTVEVAERWSHRGRWWWWWWGR